MRNALLAVAAVAVAAVVAMKVSGAGSTSGVSSWERIELEEGSASTGFDGFDPGGRIDEVTETTSDPDWEMGDGATGL